jgi:hypothetical protein
MTSKKICNNNETMKRMNSVLFAGKDFCKDKMESLNKEVVQPTVYRSLLSGEKVALPRPYFRTVDSDCYGRYCTVPTPGLGLRLLW